LAAVTRSPTAPPKMSISALNLSLGGQYVEAAPHDACSAQASSHSFGWGGGKPV
jgi:hypothetical protein